MTRPLYGRITVDEGAAAARIRERPVDRRTHPTPDSGGLECGDLPIATPHRTVPRETRSRMA